MLKQPFNGDPVITNKYRSSRYNPHFGMDYAMPRRTAIIAVADGVVTYARYWLTTDKPQNKRQWLANTESDPFKPLGFPVTRRSLKTEDYGNYVKINHGDSVSTLYAHLDEPIVFEGQPVREGELIGYSDSTGNSTGDHLHYEIRKNDRVVDPDTFDYSFKGVMPAPVKIFLYDEPIEVTVSAKEGLNVRTAGTRTAKRIKVLKKGSKFTATAYVEGELIDSNNLWFKTNDNLFIWSGGTNTVPTDLKKGGNMNITDYEAKKAELETRKAAFEEKQKDIETRKGLIVEEEEKFASELLAFKQEQEAFEAEKVEEPVIEEPEVTEPIVEQPAEVVVEDLPIEIKLQLDQLKDLEAKVAELKDGLKSYINQ